MSPAQESTNTQRIIRPLSPTENFQRRYKVSSIYRVNFSAKLHLEHFKKALAIAVDEQTLLKCQIEENPANKEERFFVYADRALPLLNVFDAIVSPEKAEELYRQAINTPLLPEEQMYRFDLIPVSSSQSAHDIDHFLLFLIIDHAISDGKSGDHFFRRFFELYDRLMKGEEIQAQPELTSLGVETFFSDALLATDPAEQIAAQQQVINEKKPDSMIQYFLNRQLDSKQKLVITTKQIVIHEHQISQLKEQALKNGVIFNSVLASLLMLAVMDNIEKDQLTLAAKFAADVRYFLKDDEKTNERENTLFSCRASTYDGYFPITKETTLNELAKMVELNDRANINKDQLFKNVYIYSTNKKRAGSNVALMISNVGQSQLKKDWEHCQINDYWAHGIAHAPLIGFAMVGFHRHLTINFYTVIPWIREDKIQSIESSLIRIINQYCSTSCEA
jgi:NRPS condensation-like uncharacterized protein